MLENLTCSTIRNIVFSNYLLKNPLLLKNVCQKSYKYISLSVKASEPTSHNSDEQYGLVNFASSTHLLSCNKCSIPNSILNETLPSANSRAVLSEPGGPGGRRREGGWQIKRAAQHINICPPPGFSDLPTALLGQCARLIPV